MKKLALFLLVIGFWGPGVSGLDLSERGLSGRGLLGRCLCALGETSARAQVGYVTYYQPVPVVQPAYPAPAYPAPAYPAPDYAAPDYAATAYAANGYPANGYPTNGVVYSSYYAPAPVPVYQPVTRVRTRYRPFLGGTVTRVRHGVVPAYYHPTPLIYAY